MKKLKQHPITANTEDGKYSKIGTTKTNNFQSSKLKAGITYWYKVTAVTGVGEGDYSGTISATTTIK